MGEYWTPKNFNFWYFFGVLSLLVLVNQLLTGVWLTMLYVPTAEGAFASVEYIMRDVEYGWLLRYMHSTGASAFFAVVYLHMFRGLLYGSYKKPRELVWLFGMLIYLALMAEGFLGYVLPWGQMSYWGAQVIVSLFGAIPVVGPDIVEWVRGDYLISGITLNRFFALHVVAVPIVLLALVVLHILALHHVGSPTIRFTILSELPYSCLCSAAFCSLCRKWAATSLSMPILSRLTRSRPLSTSHRPGITHRSTPCCAR